MTGRAPLLDHVVINVHFDMDAAERVFAALGFRLSPRGFHTLGSINHLMVLGTDYLELIGLPAGGDARRPEIVRSPVGIDGLVFKSSDVDATFAHLRALGVAGDPPRSFSRPLVLDGEEVDARFRTVAVRAGVFAAGRVYFCQHLTPELVWRDELRGHDNGARAVREVVVLATEPEREAERYAELVGRPVEAAGPDGGCIDLGGARLRVLGPQPYRERFGALASDPGARASIFGAVSLACPSFAATRARLEGAHGCPVTVEPNRVVVRVPDYDTVIDFQG